VSHTRPAARWAAAPVVSDEAVQALAEALRPNGKRADKPALPEALIRLLTVRGVREPEEAKRYLRPDREHLTPPESLTDLTRAAERLVAAVRGEEMILVHGDYDVDGICSTALLARVLRSVGARVTCFIPDRKLDGYDLGPAGVAKAREVGARVVLTCDCGTTAVEPARALRAAGVDLIITDHHQLGAEVPEAYALVNPQREPDVATRADRHLAAVGVAWKLVSVVSQMLGGNAQIVDDQLELVALATVADVAPLVGDNRIFVAAGLKRMQASRNVGLRQLIRSASLDSRRLTAGRLGFTVAPRLNALGRVRHALLGVELLLEDDEEKATELARQCNEANVERQALDQQILAEAKAMLESRDIAEARGIVLHGEGWEPGVIGIVASRIVEWTHRPTFMIAVNSDGTTRVGKGSGRSIPGFDLHAALTACGDLLEKFGGHRAAAGLTILPERIAEFAARFDAEARARLREEDLVPQLRPDIELPIHAADESLLNAIRHMEPFGIGNAGPVFISRGVRVRGGARKVAADGLKLAFETPTGPQEAVGWGMWSRAAEVERDGAIDVVYRLEMNEYRGTRTLQASLLDLRTSNG
jgi:single-stranded-DNA-specific exonuclease